MEEIDKKNLACVEDVKKGKLSSGYALYANGKIIATGSKESMEAVYGLYDNCDLGSKLIVNINLEQLVEVEKKIELEKKLKRPDNS